MSLYFVKQYPMSKVRNAELWEWDKFCFPWQGVLNKGVFYLVIMNVKPKTW
jgi:hypothetical protein